MYAHPINFLELLNAHVQYVVPRWQRRYCWGESDIERLAEDLVTIAAADSGATHYGGTLLTFPEPGAAGVVTTIRVVDGQQRLTTVSILLACIADELGADGNCGGWTRQIILDDRLTNPGKPPERRLKLKLQEGDEEEYQRGLEGRPGGAGAVSQAWRVTRRLVRELDISLLLKGLNRFRVVSIGLDKNEDPQQIFESLNATGRPLAESEKVKNWLLMGLPESEQRNLHDNFWSEIVRVLSAEHSTEPADTFLRDILRWRTGKTHGMERVYEGFRRWALQTGREQDRAALCRDLARLAGLYGKLTGTAKPHGDAKVRRELRHLRALGIDVHRPFTLRLLDDADRHECRGGGNAALAKTLAGVSAWTTRMWLADRPTAGMNRAMVELAHDKGPDDGEDFADYWLKRIRQLRNTGVGVPGDENVREGIRMRKAYGGSATRSASAVLCALMEAESREESPSRNHLTIEHVMPQKLTDEWKRDLGPGAEDIHGRYRNALANLTLSGDAINPKMGAKRFASKCEFYRKSPIGMTRRLAGERTWDEEALERRAEDLARRALERWPWPDQASPAHDGLGGDSKLRWRIGGGPWRAETAAFQMVLNVAAELLRRDPRNAERLSGKVVSKDIHPASRYPPGSYVGTQKVLAIPGHEEHVIYPYGDYAGSVVRCRKMGERCGAAVEIEFDSNSLTGRFWQFLKDRTGGVPGQKDAWQGPLQWSIGSDKSGDSVGIYVGNADILSLHVRSGENEASEERADRMRRYSWLIRDKMGDQQLGNDLDKNSENGISIKALRRWVRDDEETWPDAAEWISAQCRRLHMIIGGEPDKEF